MNKTTPIRTILAGAILAIAAADFCAGRCVLRIHRSAELARPAVCLGDIVEVVAGDAALRERLATLVVMPGGGGVKPDRVGEFEISRALLAAGINPIEVDMFGASYCQLSYRPETPAAVVQPAAVAVPVRTVADLLTDFAVNATGLERERLTVEFDCREAGFLARAADEQRYTIKPLSPVSLGAMRFDVVDGGADSQPAGRIRVSADIRYLQEAVVATRPLKPGQTIGPDDVRLVEQTLTDLDRRGLTRLEEAVGQELCRALSTNDPVLPWMVKKLAVIRRNDDVDIINEFRGIRVTLLGKAQSDGAQDEVITVQVKNSATTLRCRIMAAGLVEVVKAELAGPVADGAKGRVR